MKIAKELAKSKKKLKNLLGSDDVKTLSFEVSGKEIFLVFL